MKFRHLYTKNNEKTEDMVRSVGLEILIAHFINHLESTYLVCQQSWKWQKSKDIFDHRPPSHLHNYQKPNHLHDSCASWCRASARFRKEKYDYFTSRRAVIRIHLALGARERKIPITHKCETRSEKNPNCRSYIAKFGTKHLRTQPQI